jgi:thiol-disulfide isomerase/thioredoxin
MHQRTTSCNSRGARSRSRTAFKAVLIITITLCLALGLQLGAVTAEGDDSDHTGTGGMTGGALRLNGATFHDTILQQNPSKNGMVNFYQEWCGHCKRIKPDWDRLAREASPSVYIASVDCGAKSSFTEKSEKEKSEHNDNSKHGEHGSYGSSSMELCKAKEIRGYPSLKYYMNGDEHTYDGPRDFDTMMRFVEEELAAPCQLAFKETTCHLKAQQYMNKVSDVELLS